MPRPIKLPSSSRLVVMAIDRYQAIVHPLSTYTWTQRTGLFYMVTVWCLSLLLAVPQLFIFRMGYHEEHKKDTCMAKFLGDGRRWELTYIGWTIFVQFLLPVCILMYCYGSVYLIVNQKFSMYNLSDNAKTTSMANLSSIGAPKRLRILRLSKSTLDRRSERTLHHHVHVHYPSAECSSGSITTYFNKSPTMMYPVVFRLRRASCDGSRTANPSNCCDAQSVQQRYGASHFLSRARLKTIKLTFTVVLAYVVCSTPFYVGLIIMSLNGQFLSEKAMNWLMTIFTLLFNLNSCSNPIICLTLSSTLFR